MSAKQVSESNTESAMVKLAGFGLAVLLVDSHLKGLCDLDVDTLQSMAVAAGVMHQQTVTKACGVNCVCNEFNSLPGQCFLLAPEILQLIKDQS